MDRRRFLILGAQAGSAALMNQFFSLPLWAQPQIDSKFKYFVSVHFDSGWDVLLGLDPKVNNLGLSETAFFTGYRADQIIQANQLRFGPSAAGLKDFVDHCVVINGVSMMGNISHPDSTRFAQTGLINRMVPQIAVLKSYNDTNGQGASMLTNFPSGVSKEQFFEVSVQSTRELSNLSSSSNVSSDLYLDTDGIYAQNSLSKLKFGAKLEELKTKLTVISEKINSLNSDEMAAVALAFRLNYVQAAHLVINPDSQNLDTHSNHQSIHLNAQKNCWDKLINLVNHLKSIPSEDERGTIFDQTLIMVTSEFSRESFLNGNSISTSGKDHNGYTNSYLLLSGSLKGGYSIGESVVQKNMFGKPTLHIARNFDFRNGKVIYKFADAPEYMADPKIKKQILPGHIVRTLGDMLGYSHLMDLSLKVLPALPIKS